MKNHGPTVFVVDDDPSIQKSLSRLIRSVGYNVEVFASANEFLRYEHYEGPCCLVLDVRMPGLSGLGLQEELKKKKLSIPIIFITGHGDIRMSVKAMKSGAVDFLPKPFDDQDLIDAIYHAIEKAKKIKTEHASVAKVQHLIYLLTPREFEVLRFVISGMLNKQIAIKLGASEKTIKVHRGRIMEKMQVESVAELVRLTEKVGITPAQINSR